MSCRVQVDHELQEEILDFDAYARRQIGDFLLALQDDPLPKERQALARRINAPAYFVRLPCGFYVSWEIVGNMLRLALTGKAEGLLVRVLGVNRVSPG
jgi:mRNA-degrading endonuclease RelE of RelBE toxin-antitoxin system